MIGIRFNGKHSFEDYGITMTPNRIIGRPSKEKNKRKPPHSNREWDYSRIYGGETYTTRPLVYSFNLISRTKTAMSYESIEIINWLMNSNGQQKLYDDAIPGYHFLAEVESEADFEENWIDGVLTVEFTAYPFMIKNNPEGSPYWDDYTVLDRYQETSFEISGNKEISLFNDGAEILIPRVSSSQEMEVFKGNRTYSVPEGESESYDLYLEPGENKLTIKGDGSITFLFHKEVI